MHLLSVAALLLFSLHPVMHAPVSAPVPVILQPTKEGGYQLLREGKPYVVQGAGANDITSLAQIKAAGGNSTRTWGADKQEAFLDAAQRLGLTVTLGIWLGHKEHGFDYKNRKQTDDQFAAALAAVTRYKNHPALLFWAVGNEMELGQDGPEVYREIERIAAMIHREDPNHPVITVVADMWDAKMDALLANCPSLDALGVNSYGGLPSLYSRMGRWKKPYLVTEYGFPALGATKTPWGTAIEPNSSEKAKGYAANYKENIADHPGRVLGSYLFFWGRPDKVTAGWFNTHIKTGEKLGVVDAMTQLWTGKPAGNRAPVIRGGGAPPNETLSPGATLRVRIDASDPDGDMLTYAYEVLHDGGPRFVGDFEQNAPLVTSGSCGAACEIAAPAKEGAYRLVLIVRDGKGGAAVTALPFLVK